METICIIKDFYCGIDLHSKTMFVCIMNAKGDIHFHRNMQNNFPVFLHHIEPFRHSIAVGVESTYNWYWLADGCKKEDIPFFLGHALYMKAQLGGKKKNDKIDSKKVANLLRCNLFPPAYPYPEEMRATRDLLRRRCRFVSLRSEGYSHIQNTFSQQAITGVDGDAVKKKSTRDGLSQLLPHPDLAMSVDCDISMIDRLDEIIRKLEKQIYSQAKYHDRNALCTLLTTPGVGEMIALTILYEIHTIERFPSAQRFSSYCRVVNCERESNGKPTGGGNNKIGNPHLKWAFSEIIIHAQTQSPIINKYYEKLKSKFSPGKAKSIINHKFAVAVYHMLKNGKAFDEKEFIGQNSGGAVNPLPN